MNMIHLANDLNQLHTVMQICLALMLLGVFMMIASYVGWRVFHMRPELSEVAINHERYVTTQFKLAQLQARKSVVPSNEEVTRRMREDDTQPDLDLQAQFKSVSTKMMYGG